jgi:predicted nucleic acid-binding protein
MSARTFVDTNVLVYAVDAADPAKRQRALAVLEPTGETDLVVSAQVLSEFYVVVTRKLAAPIRPEDAGAMVDQLSRLPVVALDASLVRSAIVAGRDWHLSYWDALIIRAAEVSGCDLLLSEDFGGASGYGSVRIENPFAPR